MPVNYQSILSILFCTILSFQCHGVLFHSAFTLNEKKEDSTFLWRFLCSLFVSYVWHFLSFSQFWLFFYFCVIFSYLGKYLIRWFKGITETFFSVLHKCKDRSEGRNWITQQWCWVICRQNLKNSLKQYP